MRQNTDFSVPDKWHSITFDGELIESNEDMKKVVSDKAHYYVLQEYCYSYNNGMFRYYEYIVHNKNFQETHFEYKGLVCLRIYDIFAGRGVTRFKVRDRQGVVDADSSFGQGIHRFRDAFLFLQELDKYSGWKEFKLKEEINRLKNEINILEEQNKSLRDEKEQLQQSLEKHHQSKDLVRQLYELLQDEDTQEA